MLIEEYTPNWNKKFLNIKYVLVETLDSKSVKIEHIGSTSVPGLIAKPIIDIDLVYDSNGDFTSLEENLELIGYYHNGDQGVEGREVFKRTKNQDHPILDVVKHHLYVCHADSEELKRHILFRDKLRNDNEMIKEYASLKLHLAEKAKQDGKVYAQLKETEAKAFFEKGLK